MSEPRIVVPDMCRVHQSTLIAQAGVGPDGPWRSLIIATQIALFQAATCDPAVHAKIGGLVERLPELGCLACLKPEAFAAITEVAPSNDLGVIKALGERWVAEASA